MPIDEALTIARQIAEALEVAHEKGIIHRDLKPANIKITPDGVVKVLDFGLAKPASADAPSTRPTPIGGTREGVILGTAAYMSPQQARGQVVDKRADIWAFGCVLYEMLTGRVAFAGETVSDTIGKILEREPDWSALPAATPARHSTAVAPMPRQGSEAASEGYRRRQDRDRRDRRSAAGGLRRGGARLPLPQDPREVAAVGRARRARRGRRCVGGAASGDHAARTRSPTRSSRASRTGKAQKAARKFRPTGSSSPSSPTALVSSTSG